MLHRPVEVTHVNSIEPDNIFLRVCLASTNPNDGLPYLCKYANQEGYGAEWLTTFKLLVADADSLLDKIAREKESLRVTKTNRRTIDLAVETMRYGAKLSKKTRDQLSDEVGSFRLDATLSFDSPKSSMNLRLTYPENASNDRLISVILGWAVKSGGWKSLRRCLEPRCDKPYYFDKITRGRRPQLYCCKAHGANHRARLKRGGE